MCLIIAFIELQLSPTRTKKKKLLKRESSVVICITTTGTVRCHYNVVQYNMTLHASLQLQLPRQNINQEFEPTKDPDPIRCPNGQAHYQGSLLRPLPQKMAVFRGQGWHLDPHSPVLIKISADKRPLNQLTVKNLFFSLIIKTFYY